MFVLVLIVIDVWISIRGVGLFYLMCRLWICLVDLFVFFEIFNEFGWL